MISRVVVCADDTAGLLWELERVQRKRVLTGATQAPYTPEERAVGMSLSCFPHWGSNRAVRAAASVSLSA